MKSVSATNSNNACHIHVRGKQVIICFHNNEHQFKLTGGMRYLLEIISHPGLPVSASQLENICAQAPDKYRQFSNPEEIKQRDLHPVGSYQPIPMADIKTIHSIKQRLLNLIDELATLYENCDYARAEDLVEEKEALVAYLKEVYRPTGQPRSFGSPESLQHKRVAKSLHRALAEIESQNAELAHSIKSSLSLKGRFVYRPDDIEVEISGF